MKQQETKELSINQGQILVSLNKGVDHFMNKNDHDYLIENGYITMARNITEKGRNLAGIIVDGKLVDNTILDS